MELIARALKSSELALKNFLRGQFWTSGNVYLPVAGLQPSLAGFGHPELDKIPQDHEDLEDKKSEGFVWGVPKKRRTVEVRSSRKIGARNWYWKMFEPQTDLRICDTCGHHHRAKHLCRNCYDRIKAETDEIRSAIENKIGAAAEDKSVVVLYGEEAKSVDTKSAKRNVVVEMPKERPKWFSNNLMQRTTTEPDPKTTTITVTPKNLG